MNKIALFAFRAEIPCFLHVMLNAIDLREKGCEVEVVLEGESPLVLAELSRAEHPMHALFEKTKTLGLIAGVCRACALATGSMEAVMKESLPLINGMHGHVGMADYVLKGFQVIVF
ncbi:cytoplasmic protein [Fundidesulfovibrio soli]|uniref:cytoplasmic protein n=1 Tax=Fundidesulfovibrio soli TaxID=2922716 RepID=UPI001FAE93DC|nr:cytoplasmic protein [Fundidesulfovibrio soli]